MRRHASIVMLVLTCLFSLPPTGLLAQQDAADGPRKVLNKVPPMYPQVAKNMNIRGVVKVEAVVAPNGTVKSVEVKGGHPLLAQAAVNAVREWKWQPAGHETKEAIELKFNSD